MVVNVFSAAFDLLPVRSAARAGLAPAAAPTGGRGPAEGAGDPHSQEGDGAVDDYRTIVLLSVIYRRWATRRSAAMRGRRLQRPLRPQLL